MKKISYVYNILFLIDLPLSSCDFQQKSMETQSAGVEISPTDRELIESFGRKHNEILGFALQSLQEQEFRQLSSIKEQVSIKEKAIPVALGVAENLTLEYYSENLQVPVGDAREMALPGGEIERKRILSIVERNLESNGEFIIYDTTKRNSKSNSEPFIRYQERLNEIFNQHQGVDDLRMLLDEFDNDIENDEDLLKEHAFNLLIVSSFTLQSSEFWDENFESFINDKNVNQKERSPATQRLIDAIVVSDAAALVGALYIGLKSCAVLLPTGFIGYAGCMLVHGIGWSAAASIAAGIAAYMTA